MAVDRDLEALRTDRRTLLKGAVAVGVGAAVYSTPKVSVVPAYGQASLVSYTVQGTVMCVWFSPNQATYGQWHHDQTGYTDVANNYNPYTGTMGGTASWACYPPAMRIGVRVEGTIRYVTFVGIPDDSLWAPSGTCTSSGSTVPAYTEGSFTTPWSGGGIRITVEDPNCEMVVTGDALAGDGTMKTLGPYCNSSQTGYCSDSNATAPPATWAQGSSRSPIGGVGCQFLATSVITRTVTGSTTTGSTFVRFTAGTFTSGDIGSVITGPGIPAGGSVITSLQNEKQTISITGSPTGGTFTLTFAWQKTASMPFNATASHVQNALEGLSNIDPGDIIVTGGPLPGTPIVVEFTGKYLAVDVPLMVGARAFTGGTSPTLTVTETQPGGAFMSKAATATGTGVTLSITKPPLPCAMTVGTQPNGNVGGGVFTGTAYYHSGRSGRGQGDRCKWALLFIIRCRAATTATTAAVRAPAIAGTEQQPLRDKDATKEQRKQEKDATKQQREQDRNTRSGSSSSTTSTSPPDESDPAGG